MRRNDTQATDAAEFGVNLHQCGLRGEGVAGVGNALTIRVQWRGRRVEAAFAAQHQAVVIDRQGGEIECHRGAGVDDPDGCVIDQNCRVRADICLP